MSVLDDGTHLIRYLVVVRTDRPRRLDVIPVLLWDQKGERWEQPGERTDRVWVCGSVQRRYGDADDAPRSRLEIVAEQVVFDRDQEKPVGQG
ncbi:MAG: single-stranded DNA-binding protein [Actinobacteria bacterium]|nr:single-stranded DNA-binding protein [Actinomycetota bacterium]MCI0678119.1 single-stranded DNA-binding protein [Actinomycetota bacterium]